MRENEVPRKRRLRGVEVRERARGAEHRNAYRVRYVDGGGRRSSRTFDSAEDVLDFRGRLRLLRRRGELGSLDVGRESLEQFACDFWRLYAETQLAPHTVGKYRCLWKVHIRTRLAGMQLRQITPLVIAELIDELQREGASAHTIRSCLRAC